MRATRAPLLAAPRSRHRFLKQTRRSGPHLLLRATDSERVGLVPEFFAAFKKLLTPQVCI
jgi:hypothetical protein